MHSTYLKRDYYTLIAKGAEVKDSARLGDFVKIQPGAQIEHHVRIGDYVMIGTNTWLREHSVIEEYARLEEDLKVGAFSVVGAKIIAGGTHIGSHCIVLGDCLHALPNPVAALWDEKPTQPAPLIHDKTVILRNSTITGPVKIGPYAIVKSGVNVTRNIPPGHVYTADQRLIPFSEYNGALLRDEIGNPARIVKEYDLWKKGRRR